MSGADLVRRFYYVSHRAVDLSLGCIPESPRELQNLLMLGPTPRDSDAVGLGYIVSVSYLIFKRALGFYCAVKVETLYLRDYFLNSSSCIIGRLLIMFWRVTKGKESSVIKKIFFKSKLRFNLWPL